MEQGQRLGIYRCRQISVSAKRKGQKDESGGVAPCSAVFSVLSVILRQSITMTETLSEELRAVIRTYPVKITAHYKSLIREKDDPIWRQCMPSEAELGPLQDTLPDDGLEEIPQSPCAHLIHLYADRVVLLSTNRCFALCRFCFRKRLWKEPPFIVTEGELDEVTGYLRNHPEVRDILISGGDPLTIPDEQFFPIVDRLAAVPSLEIIRVCSRAPVFEPSRITEAFAERLGRCEKTWFMTHFNHPRELTADSLEACRRLRANGIPVLNQTVLLKGVNDDPVLLADFFHELAAHRILPHYLFHIDPIRGVAHFATGMKKGLEIMEYFRKHLSSVATPVFALDLPEGGGKVHLFPDYSAGEEQLFFGLDGKKIRHPLA